MTRVLVILVAMSVVLALAFERSALAIDHNFAGSAQLDYHYVPLEPGAVPAPSPRSTFRGFTLEASVKVAVDFSDHLSANLKLCYGCHGVEVDMVYFDARAFDELNVRVGRFSPSFGSFNLRHDPANHMLSDKPLPYDMGRMIRKADWHNGVLPSPFPTNGVEINGTHGLGDLAQLEYAAYVVSGFKNDIDPHPTDLAFQESHLPYYIDNALQPAVGARVALTLEKGQTSDMVIGASGMYGTYDLASTLPYVIAGGDISVRVRRTNIRLEYLIRRQQFDERNPSIFKYTLSPVDGDFFTKHGAYAEIEQPITRALTLLAREDGMMRVGNVANTQVGSGSDALVPSPMLYRSTVLRETLGLAYAVQRNFVVKGSVELWTFNYRDDAGRKNELSFHLGAVGSF